MNAPDYKFRWIEAVNRCPSLQHTTLRVAIEIWSDANRAGENSHRGAKLIAKNLGISLRTAQRQIIKLRELGWIIRTTPSNQNPNRDWADVYKLNIPAPDEIDLRKEQELDGDRATSGTYRATSGVDRATPWMSHQQVLPTGVLQHSASNDAVTASDEAVTPGCERTKNSREGKGTTQPPLPKDWPDDFDSVLSWLGEKGLQLSGDEETAAWHMWEGEANPHAIYNTILKHRRDTATVGATT